jgi:hypothetical protein
MARRGEIRPIPATREDALKERRTYYQGGPCPVCRHTFRWAHSGDCMKCHPEYEEEVA